MIRIPTRSRRFGFHLYSWVMGILTASAIFALHALVSDGDGDEIGLQQLDDVQLARAHDMVLLAEVGQIAREAHRQGMREAMASVQGTPDGAALQKACTSLWNLEQPR